MGVFSTPSYGKSDLSDEDKSLLQNQVDLAKRTPEDYQKLQMEGTEKAGELGARALSDQGEQDNRLAMVNHESLKDALNKRMMKQFKTRQIDMGNQAKMNSYGMMANQQQNAFKSLAENQNVKNQYYQAHLKEQSDRREARYQILGSVLGLVGVGAGTYAGSKSSTQQVKKSSPRTLQAENSAQNFMIEDPNNRSIA